MSRGVMPKRVQGRQNRGAIWYLMSTSPGFAAGAGTVVMPDAAALRRGDVAPARFEPDWGNDMRQAIARRRAMCSAWADAFGSWATAIGPCNFQMIFRNGKVNRRPLKYRRAADFRSRPSGKKPRSPSG